MSLFLYNTLSRDKEEFVPINKNKVGMYVCGPTVYDRAHIGNARPVVVFDVLYRVLKEQFENVLYVRNITDVDDKIINKSIETGEKISEITKKTTEFFHQDMAELNAINPDIEPKATEHINEMIALIEKLVEQGHAYEAQNHVLFDVSSMKDYGKLSRRSRDELIAGARVEIAPYKKHAEDFILWKPSSEGQPAWDSPWGRGRPGWHLECSAMSSKYLGDSFDIHGGGQDLIFPHHENEIAQSCCAHKGEDYAKYWVHNGHLMVDGKKMSKSLGNFYTVQEVLEKAPGEAIRYYILSTHYHQPLDWTNDGLKMAKKSLDRIYQTLRSNKDVDYDKNVGYEQAVFDALCDDINTPKAIAVLHEIVSKLNKEEDKHKKIELKSKLINSAYFLGILEQNPDDWFAWQASTNEGEDGYSDEKIQEMITKRKEARKNKDFALADKIRDELLEKNIVLEDKPDGTIWKRA